MIATIFEEVLFLQRSKVREANREPGKLGGLEIRQGNEGKGKVWKAEIDSTSAETLRISGKLKSSWGGNFPLHHEACNELLVYRGKWKAESENNDLDRYIAGLRYIVVYLHLHSVLLGEASAGRIYEGYN
ncbi:unnamed protein product [Phytophthora fragariaefolia]|uniref:Unnamed protein product n=1 Tax=Phytophthora fragariaefolia TaxID=1490495 RepID=A0A9W6XP67_9STRA|nr:unnamed protein product [Phytophthora fragariaefolia]